MGRTAAQIPKECPRAIRHAAIRPAWSASPEGDAALGVPGVGAQVDAPVGRPAPRWMPQMLDRRLKGPRRTAPLWDEAGAHYRVSHLRAARGSFCKRCGVSKGKSRPLGGSGAVLQAVPRFQRGVSPPAGRSGCFASDVAFSKGSLTPWSGVGVCFASEAEFSKGNRHFASVITLAKRGIPVKAEASL